MPTLIPENNKYRVGNYYLDPLKDKQGNQYIFPRMIEEATAIRSSIPGTYPHFYYRPGAEKTDMRYMSFYDEEAEKKSEDIEKMIQTVEIISKGMFMSFLSYLSFAESKKKSKSKKSKGKDK